MEDSETFVEQLTAHRKDPEIFYHVSCLSEKRRNLNIITRVVFKLRFQAGTRKGDLFDTASLGECCRYIKHHKLADAVVYMLGCGVGPVSATIKENCIV